MIGAASYRDVCALPSNTGSDNTGTWGRGMIANCPGRFGPPSASDVPKATAICQERPASATGNPELILRQIEQCRKMQEMDPNFPMAHFQLGETYAAKGMYTEALSELQKYSALTRNGPLAVAIWGNVLGQAGKRRQALLVLKQLKALSKERYVFPLGFAYVYAGLGDKAQAFAWLEKAYGTQSRCFSRSGIPCAPTRVSKISCAVSACSNRCTP